MTTTWTYDGVDLATFGVITMNDDYLDVPDLRGENQTISNRHGNIYVPKFYSERSFQFGMAIRKDTAVLLEQAIDDLNILFSGRSEKLLTNTRADGSVRSILAKVDGKLQTKRESYKFLRAVINFKSAQPFFRGASYIADNTTVINASPKAMSVDNTGTVEECDPIIVLTGPLSNTVILNNENGVSLTYTGTIASPRIVTIQTVDGEYVATDDLGANKIANISHSGSESLMRLEKDVNSITVTDDTHTTGSVKIYFYPPFL